MQIKFGSDGYVEGYAVVGGIEGGIEYTGEIPADFCPENCKCFRLVYGVLTLDAERQQAIGNKTNLQSELDELYEWFAWYDNQVMQYSRAVRMGLNFDKDMSELDKQAEDNRLRIGEIRQVLGENA